MATDYHYEISHVLDYDKYPDLEERQRFADAYLSSLVGGQLKRNYCTAVHGNVSYTESHKDLQSLPAHHSSMKSNKQYSVYTKLFLGLLKDLLSKVRNLIETSSPQCISYETIKAYCYGSFSFGPVYQPLQRRQKTMGISAESLKKIIKLGKLKGNLKGDQFEEDNEIAESLKKKRNRSSAKKIMKLLASLGVAEQGQNKGHAGNDVREDRVARFPLNGAHLDFAFNGFRLLESLNEIVFNELDFLLPTTMLEGEAKLLVPLVKQELRGT
ncbi:LOW QUALITY PROTEIN: hypothetical protein V2J09_008414 [Rumex salicifolius]